MCRYQATALSIRLLPLGRKRSQFRRKPPAPEAFVTLVIYGNILTIARVKGL